LPDTGKNSPDKSGKIKPALTHAARAEKIISIIGITKAYTQNMEK